MNQTHRFRKGKCIVCGSEVNILQLYNTHLSEYEDVSIPPICQKCLFKDIEYSEKEVHVR